jgi:hypothetical protein
MQAAGIRGTRVNALAPVDDPLAAQLAELAGPVLVLSTRVGRGMWSLGEALLERMAARTDVWHQAVEEFLPANALREDLGRYRAIASHCPLLLHLPYRFPPIYWRKLWRERRWRTTDLGRLHAFVRERGVRSVVAVSHRAAFWAGLCLERGGLDAALLGLLGEYGSSLGWRFVPWERVDAYLSPVPRAALRFAVPARTRFVEIELPARAAYTALRERPGSRDAVLVVCGSWGQGRVDRVVRSLVGARAGLRVHAVCGDNGPLRSRVSAAFGGASDVVVHGDVPSLAPLMAECASVVTKPGIATLVEGHAAGRQLFLLRGMPVAEDHNAAHALACFGAEWFSRAAFLRWHAGLALDGGAT